MQMNPLKIGVVGGQGPIASALFTETIYQVYINNFSEITAPPQVYLISDPLNKKSGELLSVEQCHSILLDKLKTNLSKVKNFDPDFVIVCCLSAHNVLNKVPSEDSSKVQSLVELIVEHVVSSAEKFVLLSVSTERQLKTFENHPSWELLSKKITFISEEEQLLVDSIIKDVKNVCFNSETINKFRELTRKYSNKRFIIGCSELHVAHKKILDLNPIQADIFDPFFSIIKKILQSQAGVVHR